MNKRNFDIELKKHGWDINKLEKDERVEQITENMIHFTYDFPHDKFSILPFEKFLSAIELFDTEKYTIKEFREMLRKMNLTEKNILDNARVVSLKEKGIEITCDKCEENHVVPYQYYGYFHMSLSMHLYFK